MSRISWGVEVEPQKSLFLKRPKLYLTQATLGTSSSLERSTLMVKINDDEPFACFSLEPGKLHKLSMNYEFSGDDDVTFSVEGPASIHLFGMGPTSIHLSGYIDSNNLKQEVDAKAGDKKIFGNGFSIEELKIGDRKVKAFKGKMLTVFYTLKLKSTNKVIADSNGKPFTFHQGAGTVIKGWDIGVEGMGVGGKRRLIIPPSMGYGIKGCKPMIPPNEWLVLEAELINVASLTGNR